jgi:hypothetical protein
MWSWNSRLDLQMKHAAPAPKKAWHVGRPTMPSIGSAIASDGMLLDTARWCWASRSVPDEFRKLAEKDL